MIGKRGQSQYISWILLFGMAVGISFVLYNWSIEQAQTRSDEIKSRTDPLVCFQVGISINGFCQDSRKLQFNLSNTNSFDVTSFQLRTVGLYADEEDYLYSSVIETRINSGDTEKIVMLKKGTLSQFTIIPIVKRDNKNIYCEEQGISKEDIKQC